ncbi:hypothetical protein SDC9_153689 [bioreactor metagenome]|uniref:Uncharacterized protein n=1 Tax=bioreactor metagenome TaxID=1076179 RepID=A0A645F1A6_9ZZZZ
MIIFRIAGRFLEISQHGFFTEGSRFPEVPDLRVLFWIVDRKNLLIIVRGCPDILLDFLRKIHDRIQEMMGLHRKLLTLQMGKILFHDALLPAFIKNGQIVGPLVITDRLGKLHPFLEQRH